MRRFGHVGVLTWVAFYSHLEDNQPSRRLASKLGVVHLFDLANFTFEG
ncbi:hypothetical protein HEB94_002587 [Actinopolymorpha pittospori]|uniref:Uncharacterized protein n=1 Tax=Actinopolymorpha pittospori TaxID=648752 RepID=A0A927MSA5_9ACTN|nr:hypothetical protein [Actinopolymorpha pittospori]